MNKVDYKAKKDLVKEILGNKCSRCGDYEGDPYLQFNHIPSTKPKYPISEHLSGDLHNLQSVIKNYRLLCIGCCYVETGNYPRYIGGTRFRLKKIGSKEEIEVISDSYNVERDYEKVLFWKEYVN